MAAGKKLGKMKEKKMTRKCPKNDPKMHQKCPKTCPESVPKMSRKRAENVPKTCQKSSENASKVIRKYIKNVSTSLCLVLRTLLWLTSKAKLIIYQFLSCKNASSRNILISIIRLSEHIKRLLAFLDMYVFCSTRNGKIKINPVFAH